MKKRILSLAMAIIMVFSLYLPVGAENEFGIVWTTGMTPSIVSNDVSNDITLTLSSGGPLEFTSLCIRLFYDFNSEYVDDENLISLVLSEEDFSSNLSDKGLVEYLSFTAPGYAEINYTVPDGEDPVSYPIDFSFSFTTPVGLPGGQYQYEFYSIEVWNENDEYWDETDLGTEILTVRNVSSPYTASLSSTPSDGARVGDTIDVSVDVGGTETAFASAYLSLAYNNDVLSFTGIENVGSSNYADDGSGIMIEDYGADKEVQSGAYILHFSVDNIYDDGDVWLMSLDEAYFSTAAAASVSDMTKAVIMADSIVMPIGNKLHPVTLPDIFTGPEYAEDGEDYVFAPKEPDVYSYDAVTAEINGVEVEVVYDDDTKTFTVSDVDGELEITGTASPKTFSVSFTSGSSDVSEILPGDTEYVYGNTVTFTMPALAHYSLYISEVNLNGSPVTNAYSVSGTTVTLDPSITRGDIEVVIEKSDRVDAEIEISGNASGEVTCGADAAVPGEDFTFTVSKNSSFTYTVSAANNGTAVEVTEGESGQYTIDGSAIRAGKLVITVDKSLTVGDVSVSTYLELDGTNMFLVKFGADAKAENVGLYYGTAKFFWSSQYSAYCLLTIGTTAPSLTKADLVFHDQDDETVTIAYSIDTNETGVEDANDAQFVYNMYNAMYDSFETVSMEKFLNADLNGNGRVTTEDAAVVISSLLGVE